MITKISQEQQEKIPEFIKKWIDLASAPIDREIGLRVAKDVFGKDKMIIFSESINNTIDLIKFALEKSGKKIGKYDSQLHSQIDSQLYSQLHSQLHSQLYSHLDSQLYSHLDSQLCSQLYSQIDSQIGSQLHSQLDSQLHSQLDSQLDFQLYSQIGSQLDSQLHSQIGSQLYSQLDSQLDFQLHSQIGSRLDSQIEHTKYSWYVSFYLQNWLAYYEFGKYIGVNFDEEKLKKYSDIILNMPICIFVGKLVFICEKPKVSWDNQGRLHSENKRAINWTYDNSGYFYLHGVNFQEDLFKRVLSTQMSFQEILKIENTEQRLIAMRYNPNALIKENPKLISKSERGNELWLIENSEINKIYNAPKVYLLGFIDPSKTAPNNKFYEEVDPKLAEKNPDPDFINSVHCKMTLAQYNSKDFIET